MRSVKVEVLFSPEADKEFAEVLSIHEFKALAQRYLKELFDFPPDAWVDLRKTAKSTLFRSDNHVIFDIQGSVAYNATGQAQTVKITRFRMRKAG